MPKITTFLTYVDQADPEASKRAMAAMMTMQKFDLAALRRAYDGK
jgi:hypothetical protein